MKVCAKCKEEKKLTEFSKDKTKKDGFQYKCKSCVNQYHKANKEQIREKQKQWIENNKEYYKEYYQANKERKKEYDKKYRKEYYQANKEKAKEHNKEYYQANKERIKEGYKEYKRNRIKTDPLFKMCHNLRVRTSRAFKNKGYSKNTKTKEMLGVDWEVCKSHIEIQFTKGMNWDNYGEWHIDHITPLASAKNEQEICNLCHYTNLQPLWAEDNLRKGNKII
jgi:hypothetical protein